MRHERVMARRPQPWMITSAAQSRATTHTLSQCDLARPRGCRGLRVGRALTLWVFCVSRTATSSYLVQRRAQDAWRQMRATDSLKSRLCRHGRVSAQPAGLGNRALGTGGRGSARHAKHTSFSQSLHPERSIRDHMDLVGPADLRQMAVYVVLCKDYARISICHCSGTAQHARCSSVRGGALIVHQIVVPLARNAQLVKRCVFAAMWRSDSATYHWRV